MIVKRGVRWQGPLISIHINRSVDTVLISYLRSGVSSQMVAVWRGTCAAVGVTAPCYKDATLVNLPKAGVGGETRRLTVKAHVGMVLESL